MNRPTLGEALQKTAAILNFLPFGEARTEARLLVARAAGLPAGSVSLYGATELTPADEAVLEALVRERLTGKPLQYVLGEWEFMGLPFKTDARALIPRQDTETLCEVSLALIRGRGYRRCLDLCCGSGCVGISLAKLCGADATLADVDGEALSLARENADLNGVRAQFVQSDLFANIRERYDLIACNPPYLSDAD
ncbi:MAG TPA: HemK/PrmC family methyltransferase, partial [Clostridia bacterium]|nr:HemK/PrmC family methyltransferase [Clostridia bacterium]